MHVKRSETNNNNIVRGTSVVIPVYILDKNKQPIIDENWEVYSTIKPCQFDHDYDDDWATIKTTAELNAQDKIYVLFYTPQDTWVEPGQYIMDIMLRDKESGAIHRLYINTVNIEGTPSNRYVNDKRDGAVLNAPICFEVTDSQIIQVEIPDVYLNQKNLPISSTLPYLFSSNRQTNTKELTLQTSRLREPLSLMPARLDTKTEFIISDLSEFSFDNPDNPFNKMKLCIDAHNDSADISIFCIPLASKIKLYSNNGCKELKVGKVFNIQNNERFILKTTYNKHYLVFEGFCVNKEIFGILEWFDFNF